MTDIDRRGFLRSIGAGLGGSALLGASFPEKLAGQGPGARPAPAVGRRVPEIVVIGAGAFGGWTALYLRELGVETALVDQFGPGNLLATSGAQTRSIRASYGDRELYSRWTMRSLEHWNNWQREWGKGLVRPIFTETGRLYMVPEMDDHIRDSLRVFEAHGIRHEILDHDELARRYPQINVEGIGIGLLENGAGILRARQGCEAVAESFQAKGGTLTISRATPGERTGGRLNAILLSNGETLSAQVFIFACGPWLPKVLPDVMTGRLRTPPSSTYWFATPPGDTRFMHPNLPNYNVGGVYGFPALPHDNHGFKVAIGGGGNNDPDLSERQPPAERIELARAYLARWFPAMKDQTLLRATVCHMESSVDSHYIVDQHSELENVWIVGGGSGHGFKNGPTMGEYVAHRVTGRDREPELAEVFALKPQTFTERSGEV